MSDERTLVRYREVRFTCKHVNTAKHGIWGKKTVHGIRIVA